VLGLAKLIRHYKVQESLPRQSSAFPARQKAL
jgi:hypothetical protein